MIIFHLCIEENDDREAFIKVNWSDIFSLEGYLSLAFLLALYFIPLVGLFYWLIDNKENRGNRKIVWNFLSEPLFLLIPPLT